ncbi:MAG: ATP synthase subunit I [Acidobacteria bacterium]|nr:ATP synthase subunit I [Acidobacteriota bacterium]MCI0719151.1 ATP synthase subunit I [Acidobacteriota bacterium]
MIPDSQELLTDPYYLNVEKRLTRISVYLGAATFAVACLFASSKFIVSFLLGSVISYLNFCWMKQGVDRLIGGFGNGASQLSRRSTKRVIFKYFLRYALIGGTLYAIFRFQFFDVKGAILGLLLFVAAVLFECLHLVTKTLLEEWRGRT